MGSDSVTNKTVHVELQADGRVFVETQSLTEDELYTSDGLPDVVDSIENAVELGVAVEAALARSCERVLPALDLDDPDRLKPFLAWACKKSWSDYTRGVRMVVIGLMSNAPVQTVRMLAMQNKGPRGGFVFVEGSEIHLT